MSKPSRSLFLLLLVGLTVSLITACQTGPKVETVVEEGPGRVLVVQTVRMQATVTAIDATTRQVTLKPRWGEPKTFKVRKDAINFQQVRVGDLVHAEVIEELAVTLVPGGAPPSVGGLAAVSLAPEGEKPRIVMAQTVESTATVVAIDGHARTVTLEFLDGHTQEIAVGKKRDLSKVGLGDSVRIQLTEAVAIEVVKP